jgi:hypothetical protein
MPSAVCSSSSYYAHCGEDAMAVVIMMERMRTKRR